MSQCPRCKQEIAAGAPACPSCGAPAAVAAGRPRVTLRAVRADGGPELAFNLKKDEVTIGSGAELLLSDDPFVAGKQARIRIDGAAVLVEDVGGGNGVFARLRADHPLEPGQEIRCGRQRLIFEALAPAPDGPRTWGSPDYGYRGRLVQILEGGLRGNAFMIKEGDNLLGREVGDITFPGDGFVSGRHAVVRAGAGGVSILDVGSSNGTFVRVDGSAMLTHGDQLLVGRHLLKLEIAVG